MKNLKVFVVLAVLCVTSAVPLNSSTIQESTFKSSSQRFIKKQLKESFRMSKDHSNAERKFEVLGKPSAEELNVVNFRLPNNTMPLNYNITITTNIHEGNFIFEGFTLIHINILETSNTITLHAAQMIINRIDLHSNDLTRIDAFLDFRMDSATEFLEISLRQPLQGDQQIYLAIFHTGIIRNDRIGFYRSSYFEGSAMRWFATTLFEPTHARIVFPCYDEIRYRTTFDVTVVHNSSYQALSNMPVQEMHTERNMTTTVFMTTPVMPTYNVAFTVSNFQFISNKNETLEMKVYARQWDIDFGRANGALDIGELMWGALENMFGIPYPLPKCDMFAVNNWRNGESWGLIKIDDWSLLSGGSIEDNRLRRINIAHELSHTYFSNLVSPTDWRYLWLNEGFATLYENIINDIVFPDTLNWENFLLFTFDVVLDADILGGLDPLNLYVESPREIARKFDFTTYQKGAVILRMLKDAIGEEVFVQGVRYYLEQMQMQSATPTDLFSGIQRAIDESSSRNDVNIKGFMDAWLNNRGLPIVTVSRSPNGLLLTQSSIGSDEDVLFSIPINYATASEPNFDDVKAEFWMTTRQHEIARESSGKTWTDDDWIIFNLRDTGYYVTNYDETLWNLITTTLANDLEAVSFLNRGTLFADARRLIEVAADFPATIFLELIGLLKLEFHPHVWQRSNWGLTVFENRLRGSEIHEMYLSYLNSVMTGIYGRTFENAFVTNVVNRHSCVSGVKACSDDALQALIEFRDTGRTSFPFAFRCNAFRVADETIWMHFFDDALSRSQSWMIMDGLRDLECTQNAEFIQKIMDVSVDSSIDILPSDRVWLVFNAIWENHEGYKAAIELVKNHHEVINERFGETGMLNIISLLSGNTNTECQAEKVLELLKYLPESQKVIFDRAFFRGMMEPNIRFFTKNSESIHEWLENIQSKN